MSWAQAAQIPPSKQSPESHGPHGPTSAEVTSVSALSGAESTIEVSGVLSTDASASAPRVASGARSIGAASLASVGTSTFGADSDDEQPATVVPRIIPMISVLGARCMLRAVPVVVTSRPARGHGSTVLVRTEWLACPRHFALLWSVIQLSPAGCLTSARRSDR